MVVQQIRMWSMVALVAAMLIATPGCSSADGPGSPVKDTPNRATSGIRTLMATGGQATYGVIDPASGQYSKLVTFKIPNARTDDIAVSPDFTKYAADKTTDGKSAAGWVDSSGNFTAVAQPDTPGPFGGPGSSVTAIGFDGSGNYYYRSMSRDGYAVFKVPAGSTSGAQQVPLSSDRAEAGAWLNFDGTMQFGCTVGVHTWLGPNAVVSASGPDRIDKWPVTGRDKFGCPVTGTSVTLLPSTNTAHVHDAVGSPDGTKVAFLYDTNDVSAHHPDLYLVAADGAGQPTKLAVQIPNSAPYEILTLLKWS